MAAARGDGADERGAAERANRPEEDRRRETFRNTASPGPDVDTAGEDYARRFAGAVGRWFLEVQERMLTRALADLPENARVLDVGGLHGQLVPALLRVGHRVVVLGSAPVVSERLRSRLEGGSCQLHVGELTRRLPYSDGTFDAAVSFRLLPHVDDPQQLVAELCRVARRYVVVDYPSTRSVNAAAAPLFSLKKRVEGNTRPFRVFRPAEVREWFREEGFQVAEERGQYFFPMVLHRALRSRGVSRALEAAADAAGLRRSFGSPVILRADRGDRGES